MNCVPEECSAFLRALFWGKVVPADRRVKTEIAMTVPSTCRTVNPFTLPRWRTSTDIRAVEFPARESTNQKTKNVTESRTANRQMSRFANGCDAQIHPVLSPPLTE